MFSISHVANLRRAYRILWHCLVCRTGYKTNSQSHITRFSKDYQYVWQRCFFKRLNSLLAQNRCIQEVCASEYVPRPNCLFHHPPCQIRPLTQCRARPSFIPRERDVRLAAPCQLWSGLGRVHLLPPLSALSFVLKRSP